MKPVINMQWFWITVIIGPIMVIALDINGVYALLYLCVVVMGNILAVLCKIYQELNGIRNELEDERKKTSRKEDEKIYLLAQIKADVYNYKSCICINKAAEEET